MSREGELKRVIILIRERRGDIPALVQVERALILSQGKPLTFADLDSSSHPVPEYGIEREDEPLTLDQVMGRHIRRVLKMIGGKSKAQEALPNSWG